MGFVALIGHLQSESPLQVRERSQLFIGTHNEMLSVAVCVSNPNCLPFTTYG
jgi:hypothetical protein